LAERAIEPALCGFDGGVEASFGLPEHDVRFFEA